MSLRSASSKFSAFQSSDAEAHQRRSASAYIAARAKASETYLQVSNRDPRIALGQRDQPQPVARHIHACEPAEISERFKAQCSYAPLRLRIRLNAAPLIQGETNSSQHHADAGDHRKLQRFPAVVFCLAIVALP